MSVPQVKPPPKPDRRTAHQEVIFGNQGEGLILRHDSYDRSSFMTGVNLGIKEVVKRHELVYGLEHLL